MFPDLVQLRRIAFINKNIAPEGWTFALLISISCVGTPFFISFLGFTYIELQNGQTFTEIGVRVLFAWNDLKYP